MNPDNNPVLWYQLKHRQEPNCEDQTQRLAKMWMKLKTLPKNEKQAYSKLLFQEFPDMVEFAQQFHSKSAPIDHWVWNLSSDQDRSIGENDQEKALTCIICENNVRRVLFKPCKHFKLCIRCTRQYVNEELRNNQRTAPPRCVECRQSIEGAEIVII